MENGGAGMAGLVSYYHSFIRHIWRAFGPDTTYAFANISHNRHIGPPPEFFRDSSLAKITRQVAFPLI